MRDSYRNISLILEVSTAFNLLEKGLGEIQKITAANDFYHPTLYFLSSGLERLFKTMLFLNFKEKYNKLPTRSDLLKNNNGHDIEYLKTEIEKICTPSDIPLLRNDFDIITKDEIINSICKILSKYGQKGRYFNLDAALGTEQDFDIQDEWENVETKLLTDHLGKKELYKMLKDPQQLDLMYELSNKLLVSRLELFLRAIARQFLIGNFSSESKKFSFEIQVFTSILDKNIGTKDYRS